MNELKKDLLKAHKELIHEFMDCIKEGEENGGLDLADLVKAETDYYDKFNNAFFHFEEAQKDKKKRWF
jgi:hypothetical protein